MKKVKCVSCFLVLMLVLSVSPAFMETGTDFYKDYIRDNNGGDGLGSSDSVAALLKTKWEMGKDYAKFVPCIEKSLMTKRRLGCWTVAFAQILYYHWMAPHGSQEYLCHDKINKIYENFNYYQFDFNRFVDEIEDTTPFVSSFDVAKYLYFCAVAIQKDFFPPHQYKYMVFGSKRAAELQDHYYVSTKVYTQNSYPRNSKKLRDLIISELKDARPMFLFITGTSGSGKKGDEKTGMAHAVVIDGYKFGSGGEFMVHINFGWGNHNKENRYYDINAPIGSFNNTKDHFLVTIKPTKQMKGYELFFNNKKVGSEPNWSFFQAVSNLLWNRKRHSTKKVEGRYNREVIVVSGKGYELYWDYKRVGHKPNFSYNKAKTNLLWNIRNHPKKKVVGLYNGKQIKTD